MLRVTLCLFLAVLSVYGQTAENPDEIKSLPGLNFSINFKHYSGYLNASETHMLHYWFVESQNDPAKDPVILWLNGGPGCSSLEGLLHEMGPYVITEDGKTLAKNDWAWNKFASVIYIEAPAGVGFSYSTSGNTTTNDDLTSQENYNAVKAFFGKFPQFRANAFYTLGESYGGVYVPTLTARIVEGQKDFPINLRGMAIGNGYLNEKLNIDTSIRFAYGHGIIDEKIWNTLESECCQGMVEDIFQFLWFGGLNPYDLYGDCDPNPDVNSIKMKAIQRGLTLMKTTSKYERMMKNTQFEKYRTPLLGSSVPCMNDTDFLMYMNSKAVREAIHIPDHVGRWDICSEDITKTYQKQYTDTAPFFHTIIKANVRILLYYGDVDMACNFMMGQQFSASLGLKRRLSKQPWKFDRQIAGFKTIYDGLTFLTVRGAGHMAPQWKAPQMYYAMQQFLLNHPI
uniref:Carboxypeptidase n=1 Tax=Rhabditophanes sp. KR3021 TaxID=114890 RepID=A0AC35TM41_9BILA